MIKVLTGTGYPYPPNVWDAHPDVRFVSRNTKADRAVQRLLPGAFYPSGRGCDLIHLFNGIPLRAAVPFVVTFESFLPRSIPIGKRPRLESLLWERLRSPRCTAIDALSHYAIRQFDAQNAGRPGYEEVRRKIEVLYPSFPIEDAPKDRQGGSLRLLFVGRTYVGKGGGIVARAHKLLRERGVDVETTVVSSLDWSPGDFVAPDDPKFVEAEVARLDQPGIRHVRSLSSEEVRKAMRASDLFLAPTFHDTFGYAQCEALSSGTPAIVTRTCAQTEIVGDAEEWLLDLPIDSPVGKWTGFDARWTPGYTDLYAATSDDLAAQLADRVQRFADSAEPYRARSERALARARSLFDKGRHAERLRAQYRQALGR